MNLTHTLNPAGEAEGEMVFPRVTGLPYLCIWSVSIRPGEVREWTEKLYQALPAYWQSAGLIDCKLMLATDQSALVIIESWTHKSAADDFKKSETWQGLFPDGKQGQPGVADFIKLVDNTFELIE